MSNSNLVTYTQLSPNCNHPRSRAIDRITIHCMAADGSLEALGREFAKVERQASANYGVDSAGRIGLYVNEEDRAWTSSNNQDERAVTIEVANDGGSPDWHVSDKALEATISLCVDVCRRNGIKALNFTGDAAGNLTMHKWFAATGCPGPYLESKFPYIASEVNRRLGVGAAEQVSTLDPQSPQESTQIYRVQVGAFKVKANAERLLQQIRAAGFESAFIASADSTTPPIAQASVPDTAPPAKSAAIVAAEVIQGLWGSGVERKTRLEAAGYNYDTIQQIVNELLG